MESMGTMHKVFGIGLSKTGVDALSVALECLGFRIKQLPLSAQDYCHYQALCGSSVAAQIEEVDALFPGAKFIYTIRQKEGWLKECRRHFSKPTSSGALREIRQRLYGCEIFDEKLFSASYDMHDAKVRKYFHTRPADLLVLDVSIPPYERWHALRAFVGCTSPIAAIPQYIQDVTETDVKSRVLGTELGWRLMAQAPAEDRSICPTEIITFSTDPDISSEWNHGTFAYVTLWGGSLHAAGRVFDWLKHAEIPPNSRLYWVDNTGGVLSKRLRQEANGLSHRFQTITILDGGDPYKPTPSDTYFARARHEKIAELYNQVFRDVSEDYIVIVEDDTLPPLKGTRQLCELMFSHPDLAMAAGVYRTRTGPERICASLPNRRDQSKSGFQPFFDRLPTMPFEVDRSGAGFGLLRRSALSAAMPMRFDSGKHRGWDINLCFDMRAEGWRVGAHPKVVCAHLCEEVLQFEAKLEPRGSSVRRPEPRQGFGAEADYLAIVTCVRDEEDIIEWVEWHAALGVERFYIYDNCSFYPLQLRLLPYIQEGLVRVIPFPGWRRQIAAFAHFLEHYKSTSRWAAFIDADEFIVPHVEDCDLRNFLEDYEDYCALGINWQMFGPNSQSHRAESVIHAYTRRAEWDYGVNEHVKTVAQLRYVIGVSGNPHTLKFSGNRSPVDENKQQLVARPTTGFSHNTPPTVSKIQLNHYHSKSKDDWKLKQARGGGSGRVRTDTEFLNCVRYCNAVEDLRAKQLAARLQMSSKV